MRYMVRFSKLSYGQVEVEAKSEEEAKTIASGKAVDYFDEEITDVTAEPIGMINADTIRRMDNRELAEFLVGRCGCPPDRDSDKCTTGACDSCWWRWLTKKAETGNGRTYTVTECCPHCQSEIEMRWNTDTDGFKAFCPVCGNRLMLCDECSHAENSKGCDYDTRSDSCRYSRKS